MNHDGGKYFTKSPQSNPPPHPTNIHMHEIRVWIIADAASLHCKRHFVELIEASAGQRDVNCLPLHMQAVRGHAKICLSKHGVGFWRSITRVQLEMAVGVELDQSGE